MKTTSINGLKKTGMMTCLFIVLSLATTPSKGQNFGRNSRMRQTTSNRFLVGIESGVGSTSLKFSSDVKDLQNLKFNGQGWNVGLLLGDRQLKLRATFGKYSFEKSMNQSINQNLISTKIIFSPSRLFTQSKYFRLYLLTGADYSIFSFDGMTIPKFQDPNAVRTGTQNPNTLKNGTQQCCCPSSSDPGVGEPVDTNLTDGEPDENSKDKQVETVAANTVSLKKGQINAGFGAEFHGSKNGRYFRMFAEAYYGIPLKEIVNNLSLGRTSVSAQMVINFGIGIGISR